MLVCTSNWLLSDGSLSSPPSRRSVLSFVEGLRSLAGRAGFRRDGRYRPIDAIDLVLAGDTLDTTLSSRWQSSLRPWHTSAAVDERLARVAIDALRKGRHAVAAVRQLARRGLTVPEATSLDRPAHGSCRRVPVRIVILPGDRDRIIRQLRLASRQGWSWLTLAEQLTRGTDEGFLIAHGDGLDPTTATSACGLRSPSLVESVTCDFVGPLVSLVRQRLPAASVLQLGRSLACARPLDLPHAARAWARRMPLDAAAWQTFEAMWREAVDRWHAAARRDPPAFVHAAADPCDAFAGWLEACLSETVVVAPPLPLREVIEPAPRLLPRTRPPHARRSRQALGAGNRPRRLVLGQLPTDEAAAGMADEAASTAATDRPPAVIGLAVPWDQGDRVDHLSWVALCDDGEHAGRHVVSEAGGHLRTAADCFAAEVIPWSCPRGVVDAIRAA